MIKEAYDKLRKEHPILPEFDKINREFQLSTIEKEDFLLSGIKEKIADTIEPVIQVIERIVQPDPNMLSDMYESTCFTKGEKNLLFDIYRKLMQTFRLLLETDLQKEDKADAETIKKTYDEWQGIRKQIAPYIKKMREHWQKHVEPKEILEYLG
jgi:hypothetical protein